MISHLREERVEDNERERWRKGETGRESVRQTGRDTGNFWERIR